MLRSTQNSRAGGAPLPRHLSPMLAVLGELPANPAGWSFEFKWDGVRAISYWDGRRLSIESRNGIQIAQRYPELRALGEALGGDEPAVLDGEIIATDDAGNPSFALLQHRMHVDAPSPALLERVAVQYIVFDLLYVSGRSIMDLGYLDRRQRLEELTVKGPAWRVSPCCELEGQRMLDIARQRNLEGIVAKRSDSLYEPGRRSPAWRKIKLVQRQELVIGGWVSEKLSSTSRIGALLLGYFQDGRLRYAGSVGTGFGAREHAQLAPLLLSRQRRQSPFNEPIRKPGAHWCAPVLVAEVEYRRWPEGGLIQQAAYKGLRSDKPAQQVGKEHPLR